MKIAILTSGILPVPAVQGGAVETLIDFCLEYNDKNLLHDITVYSVSHPALKENPNLHSRTNHYHFIDMNSPWARIFKKLYGLCHRHSGFYHYSVEYYLWRALRHIRHQQYNMVIVENRPGYILKLKDCTTATLVLHQENDYLNTHMKQYKVIYDALSRIINTSAYVTECVKTINSHDTKCKNVLNGIDVERFVLASALPREIVGLKSDDFVIVFSGRLTEDKGILPLIEAIRRLSIIPKLRLLVIGASAYGKDKVPTPFVSRLQKEAESINEKVIFTDFINYRQIPSYLKIGDIAIVPSMWEEPFGLTVIEAMAAGLPLITTRSGGIPEICEGVATIVERDDIVNNLAQAILDLYEHPEKRQQMAAAGLERSKLFDKETYAKNFFAALEDI